ncbi:DUF2071 domain-containing protein [Bacillus sp. BRMEA1]|uniref:YqjF family protein n=1 Tax=Neobacillus endophyticus TaxID=2738405 RepID=UPI0015657596|nr:DUF2071 domain-containing protein [Neobacillus endophyticus]NRD76524.1 DUF2071 domain-containing protein [Neobacillus endophyticus]
MNGLGPWIMTQTWEHLLFLHWKMAVHEMAPLLPNEFELDTYQDDAWLTMLPFQVSHQQFHWLPEIPLLLHYWELNVRTYVKYKGQPGVYFFSLDANHPLAVLGAKAVGLPFRQAKMDIHHEERLVFFNSRRWFGQGTFAVEYEPYSLQSPVTMGSLDDWLLERYCLFTKMGNWVLRGDIRHEKWKVSGARVRIKENSASPLHLKNEPILAHYCNRKKAYIFPFKKV